MKNKEQLLKTRKIIKRSKPEFLKQDHHKKKRIPKKWGKPKGLHSKMRHGLKGHVKLMSSGYRSPKAIRSFDKSGMKEIIIFNVDDLNKLTKDSIAVISKNTGRRKRLDILKKCKEKGLKVSNVKDIEAYINDVKTRMNKKKEEKQKKMQDKDKKKKEREVFAKKKEEEMKKGKGEKETGKEGSEDLADKLEEEDREQEEEKKRKEKEEKDKVLTMRQ